MKIPKDCYGVVDGPEGPLLIIPKSKKRQKEIIKALAVLGEKLRYFDPFEEKK